MMPSQGITSSSPSLRRASTGAALDAHALRSYEDRRAGITETFLTPTIGGAATVAVLSQPLDEPNGIGWIVCHPFGVEQIHLQAFESLVARTLAADGHTVLRFHAQGYGDSQLPTDHVSLESQLHDSVEAVRILSDTSGIARLGLIGARMGGAIAALVAGAVGADALVVCDPIVNGSDYVSYLLRFAATTKLADRAGDAAKSPEAMLREGAVLNVGFALTAALVEELSAFELTDKLNGWGGAALVLEISARSEHSQRLLDLVARLQGHGASVTLETLVHAKAHLFGQPRYVAGEHGRMKDRQPSLYESIAEMTASWARRIPTNLPGGPSR